MNKFKTVVLLTVIIGGVLLWLAGSGEKRILATASQASKTTAVQVVSTKVVLTENSIEFEALGTGRAQNSVELFPAVSEEVTSIAFSSGDKVEKGAVLVQLDDAAEQLAQELAEVELAEAKRLLKRYERAVQDGAVPESEVDSARAAVKSAKVALQQAKLAIRDRKIIAPFAGYVGIARVDPGERVSTSTLITGLDNRDTLLLDFEVPEKLAAAVSLGQTVRANTPAYPGRAFRGKVAAVESRVNRESRTVLTRATLDNSEDLLRPGMSFSMRLHIPGDSFPTVPEISVQWADTGAYVWVIRDNEAHREPVSIVARSAGRVLVDGKIAESELVVVEGLQRLEEGREVVSIGTIDNPALSNTATSEGS